MTLIDHIFEDSFELVNHRYLLFTQLSAGLCTYLAEKINKSTRELCLENKTEQSMNFKNHTVFLLKLFYLVSKVRPIFTEVVSFVKNYHLIEKNYHLIESWKLFSYSVKLDSQNKFPYLQSIKNRYHSRFFVRVGHETT